MEISEFIQKLENAIEGVPEGSITPQTNYKSLEEWDSLSLLTVMAMIDSDYEVTVSGDEINSCKSVENLFEIVISRK